MRETDAAFGAADKQNLESGITPPVAGAETIISVRGREVRAQSEGQLEYVQAIDASAVVFGVGPAGTGKTYLAVAKAVQALHRRDVARIVLTRPAVEAGERLGHLPGSLQDKVDPYLRPLFDALSSFMATDTFQKLLATGTVEVAPLAYMRGRTLDDAFVILDEAQNTTPEQMKMFLTRLGFASRMVITGDPSQRDLPRGTSGLDVAQRVLRKVEGIEFVRLGAGDIVRHGLVANIVNAYETYEREGSK